MSANDPASNGQYREIILGVLRKPPILDSYSGCWLVFPSWEMTSFEGFYQPGAGIISVRCETGEIALCVLGHNSLFFKTPDETMSS